MIIDNAINSEAVIKKDAIVDRSTSHLQSQSDVNEVADYEYAGFWIRVGASLIDTVVMMLLIVPLFIMFVGTANLESPKPMGLGEIFLNYLFPALFIILFWAYKSATPGKMILGLKIVSAKDEEEMSKGQMIIRYIGYYPSALIICIGFIWVAFDAKKQGWHDKLAGTVVVRTR